MAYFVWGYGGWISGAHASPAAFDLLLLLTFIAVVFVCLLACMFLLISLYFLLLSFNRPLEVVVAPDCPGAAGAQAGPGQGHRLYLEWKLL